MPSPESQDAFETLLNYLKASRGFDFTGYKRASLRRRIDKRMQTVDVAQYDEYLDYLEVNPDEFAELFNTILINVTDFFRDPPAWDYLEKVLIPQLLAQKPPDEPLRVWCAGCATGEEAYTLAMLLAEAMSFAAFRERVKIYATDADEQALNIARQATYPARQITSLPPALLEKYFEPVGGNYVFHKELRRQVIFGRNNLVQDAPISRIDLLACRNTLMYFNSETQGRILARFHFALRDAGFLLLGRAEMLFTHASAFSPVNIQQRLFAKIPRVPLRDSLVSPSANGREAHFTPQENHIRLREAAFNVSSGPCFVVDEEGRLIAVNDRARSLYRMSDYDIGRPMQDLEFSYRPIELRSHMEQAMAERRPVHVREVLWPGPNGENRWLELQITPLLENGEILGLSINFTDLTRYHQLQEEVERSNQELETASEELQSTVEELETTNEELQSTVEELETTNEELQSTNEELETMNEEIQSTNEELQTINEELRQRSAALDQANAFLESILTSLRGGVVVVDSDVRVLIWNRQAEELWGLRSHEAEGKNFLLLDIGLPLEDLRQPIRSCITGEADYQEMILEAVNRRGKPLHCKVICTPLLQNDREQRGAIIVMEGQGNFNGAYVEP